ERQARSLDLNTLIGPKTARPRPAAEPPPAASAPPRPAAPAPPAAAPPTPAPQPIPSGPAPASPAPPIVAATPAPAPRPPVAPAVAAGAPAAALPPVDPAALDAEAHAVHAHLRELTGVEDLGFVEEVLSSYLRADLVLVAQLQEIGRASCRERGYG